MAIAPITTQVRVLAFGGLLIAAFGLLNLFAWENTAFGLTPKQIAIIAFSPLFLLTYYLRSGPLAGMEDE